MARARCEVAACALILCISAAFALQSLVTDSAENHPEWLTDTARHRNFDSLLETCDTHGSRTCCVFYGKVCCRYRFRANHAVCYRRIQQAGKSCYFYSPCMEANPLLLGRVKLIRGPLFYGKYLSSVSRRVVSSFSGALNNLGVVDLFANIINRIRKKGSGQPDKTQHAGEFNHNQKNSFVPTAKTGQSVNWSRIFIPVHFPTPTCKREGEPCVQKFPRCCRNLSCQAGSDQSVFGKCISNSSQTRVMEGRKNSAPKQMAIDAGLTTTPTTRAQTVNVISTTASKFRTRTTTNTFSPSEQPMVSPSLVTAQPEEPKPRRAPLCESTKLVRKNVLDLSDDEWNTFVSAVDTLHSRKGADGQSLYDAFTNEHALCADEAHGGQYFLPWHRQFLYEFEAALRSISPSVTLPYWDWSEESTSWFASKIWERVGGANGNYVPGPVWANWTSSLPFHHKITRRALANKGTRITFESKEKIDAFVKMSVMSYETCSRYIESIHAAPHVSIGGDMGNGLYAPGDPLFYLHHAFVDKIWSDWQRDGGGTKFSGWHRNEKASWSRVLSKKKWGRTVGEIVKGLGDCVEYQERSGTSMDHSHAPSDRAPQTERQVVTHDTVLKKSDEINALRNAIQRKLHDPRKYSEAAVAEARSEVVLKHAARVFSGLDMRTLEEFGKTRRLISLVADGVLPYDVGRADFLARSGKGQIAFEALVELQHLKELNGTIRNIGLSPRVDVNARTMKFA